MSSGPAAEAPLARLRSAVAAGEITPELCGFFFDFDGTLAPIEARPELVRPVPGVVERLARLTGTGARVALVSARPVDYLQRTFADVVGARLFGLYGFEADLSDGIVRTHPSAGAVVDLMAELAERARRELPPGDLLVEFKRAMIAVHYRHAPQLREAVLDWVRAQADRYGLVVQAGRMVVELKPSGGPDKGSVVAEQAAGLSFASYAGDDIGDIPAFQALRRLATGRADLVVLTAAVANPESGAAVARHAGLHLAGPGELPGLLDAFLDCLSAPA